MFIAYTYKDSTITKSEVFILYTTQPLRIQTLFFDNFCPFNQQHKKDKMGGCLSLN